MGLLRAATRYNPRAHNNTPFPPFARPYVHGAIIDSTRRRHYTNATHLPLEAGAEARTESKVEVSIDIERRARRIRVAVTYLEPAQQAIVRSTYGNDRTLRETGVVIDISRGKAKRIHAEAMGQLRRMPQMRRAG